MARNGSISFCGKYKLFAKWTEIILIIEFLVQWDFGNVRKLA